MMNLGWSAMQNYGSKGPENKVPMVWMGQTSKNYDTLILTTVAANNKPVTQLKGSYGNRKFSLNDAGLGLVIGHVCSEALHSITPIVVRALEFVSDYAS